MMRVAIYARVSTTPATSNSLPHFYDSTSRTLAASCAGENGLDR